MPFIARAAIALGIVSSTAAAELIAQAPLSADSGTFVVRLGRDTLKVERFVLRDSVLRAEAVRRGTGVELQRVDATLNADGSIARMDAWLYSWPLDAIPRPTGGARVYVQGDSTILELGLRPNTQRVAYAGRGHIFNFGVNPLMFSLFVSRAAYAPARVGDSTAGQHMVSTLGVWPLVNRRVASNLVTVHSNVMGTMRVRVDSALRVQELDGTGSSLNYHAERIGMVNLDSVARSFAEMNRRSGSIAALSPPDSVVATVGGAKVKIEYGRPSKRGRLVFGGIVPWGRVWRTGANLATHLTTDRALVFGSTVVPPGRYTLFTLPAETGWTLIINRATDQWGTEYDPAQDLARIPMRTRALDAPVEKLAIAVETRGRGGVIRVSWDTIEAFADFSVR